MSIISRGGYPLPQSPPCAWASKIYNTLVACYQWVSTGYFCVYLWDKKRSSQMWFLVGQETLVVMVMRSRLMWFSHMEVIDQFQLSKYLSW